MCEVAFLISAAIIALYFWTYFSDPTDIDKLLTVNIPAVSLAGVTLLFCFVSYLWSPTKHILINSLTIYLLITATAAMLIISTGETSSPFVALWMLISIFAGIFGLLGTLPILIVTGAFVTMLYINANLTITSIIIIVFSSVLPLIASLLIWQGKSTKEEINNDNKAYRSLANELSEVASKSEVVINAIGDGVIVIDGQGIIQLINPAAQNIIGWGKQDALALNYKSVLRLVNPKDETLDPIKDPIQQSLNSNQEIRSNNQNLITSSGNKIMVSMVASPVGVMGSGIITVFHDVTAEKAEEREQAEFISTASHEMRTPVASIEGYLGLALNHQTATIDERARDFIMKAHDSADHLGHLFQDLLDVTNSDDGRLSNKPAVVNVVLFIHDIIQGLQQKANEKNLELIYNPMPDNTAERYIAPAYFVNLDNDHIREIINNLVENAIKYTTKGKIIIDITADEERVIISVKDSGIGIPAEDMVHLFQKFYRVDNKATRSVGGTGLGLYLCRRLAEMMGGSIWVESIFNNGSTFFLELPRISGQEASRLSEIAAATAIQEASEKVAEIPIETTSIIEPIPVPKPVPIEIDIESIKPAPIPKPTPIVNISKPVEPIPVPKPILVEPNIEKVEPVEPIRHVPRGQDLTPEQIAEYVAKQRILAQQQATPQLSRPRSISIPVRIINK